MHFAVRNQDSTHFSMTFHDNSHSSIRYHLKCNDGFFGEKFKLHVINFRRYNFKNIYLTIIFWANLHLFHDKCKTYFRVSS